MSVSFEATKTNLLEYKNKLFILILGSYEKESLYILRNVKDYLIERGWTKCRLAEDFSYPIKRVNEEYEEYIERKSITLIERSDSCIFIFNCNVDNGGVLYELKHACDHLEAKLETSVIAIDNKCRRVATTLIRGKIKRLVKQKLLNVRYFKSSDQLNKFCNSALLSHLKILAPLLVERY